MVAPLHIHLGRLHIHLWRGMYDEFKEAEHPREKGGEGAGQFTKGGGSGETSTKGGATERKEGSGETPAKTGKSSSPTSNLVAASKDRTSWPKHIQAVKVPPAWSEVHYSEDPKAKVLVTGRDQAGRKQAVYNKKFSDQQSAKKFAKVAKLVKAYDSIAANNAKSGDREHATCLDLIMKMGLRPGSDTDTKAKVQAYGATTLQGQHVVSEGDETRLKFTGKKGVAINLPVTDAALAKELQQRAKSAGSSGRLFPSVSDASLRKHSAQVSKGQARPKDFRTLLATKLATDMVAGMPAPTNDKEYKKSLKDVAKHVSSHLGNTPTVALQSYIAPQVFSGWSQS